jgi:soluble lytic murein transglycosylase-like protein
MKKIKTIIRLIGIGSFLALCTLVYLFITGHLPVKEIEAVSVRIPREVDIEAVIAERNPAIDPFVRQHIAATVRKYSEIRKLDPALVASVIAVESSFDPMQKNTDNEKGIDRGLMMINDYYQSERIKSYGLKSADLYHIDTSIRLGTEVLRENLDRFGELRPALQAYVGKRKQAYPGEVLAIYGELQWGAK